MAVFSPQELQDMTCEAALSNKTVPDLLGILSQINESDSELRVVDNATQEIYRQHLLAYDRAKARLP